MKDAKFGITLIGMPGSGKSTIGKILAERIGWRFLDLDLYMKEKTGKTHQEILAEAGPDEFINLEGSLVKDIDFKNLIFSPGGSIIYSQSAMDKVSSLTKIIYLRLPIAELRNRIGDQLDFRGIVGLKDKGFEGLYAEREPIYNKFADFTIDCDKLSSNDIVESMVQLSDL